MNPAIALLVPFVSRRPNFETSFPMVQTVGKLVSDLGAQAGRNFRVSNELRDWPIYLEPHGKLPEQLLKSIATGLHATFVESPSGLEIKRTDADNRNIRKLSIASTRRLLVEELGRIDADVAQAKGLGTTSIQVALRLHQVAENVRSFRRGDQNIAPLQLPLHEFTPAGHLLRALVDCIGVDRLSAIPPGEVRVFSNQPNPSELPINGCSAALTRFISEQNNYFVKDPSEECQQDIRDLGELWLLDQIRLKSGDPLKLLVTENRRSDGVTLDLDVYDQSVNQVAFSGFFTQHVVVGMPFSAKIRPILASPTSHWIPLEGPSVDYIKRFASDKINLVDEDDPRPATAARDERDRSLWPEAGLYPDRVDPDNFAVREALTALAEHDKSKAFVAVLPDSIWSAADAAIDRNRVCLEGFESLLRDAGQCEQVLKDDAAILRPLDPLISSRCLLNRKEVGERAREMVNAHRITPAGWADYCLHAPLPEDDILVRFYDEKLSWSGLHKFRSSRPPREVYRLMGILNERGRFTPSHGAHFRIDAPPDIDHIVRWLSQAGALKPFVAPGPLLGESVISGLPPLKQHLTELYPEGRVSVDLDFGTDSEPAYVFTQGDKIIGLPFGMTAGMTAGLYFADPFLRTSPERFDAYVRRRFDRPDMHFHAGRQVTYHIRITVAGGCHRDFELTEDMGYDGATLAFADIPPSYWEDARNAMMSTPVRYGSAAPDQPVRRPPPP